MIHDYGYRIAENETDRAKADLFFLMNMLMTNEVIAAGCVKKFFRRYRAFHYYLAVSVFGRMFCKKQNGSLSLGNKSDLSPKGRKD